MVTIECKPVKKLRSAPSKKRLTDINLKKEEFSKRQEKSYVLETCVIDTGLGITDER